MVGKENPVYLFIGQDSLSKDARLKELKKEFLTPQTECFNFDLLYGRELILNDLQEKLLSLPLKAKKRILVIKEAHALKDDIKEFLIQYAKKPHAQTILVLDINKYSSKDELVKQISRTAQVCRFQEETHVDTFTLSRAIDSRKSGYAMGVLNQLLRSGEKPERILGGLRYSLENSVSSAPEARKKLRLLLNCDIDIKTGRLKADFALERLVISLCCLAKPFG
jgi:DNA polymerase III delta subunit